MAITNSKSGMLLIVAVAAIAAFFVLRLFFPQIIEQIAAGIVAFFVFLAGLIFSVFILVPTGDRHLEKV